MQVMNVATKIDFPIVITVNDKEEIVGQFYASIGRNLDNISIQMYINNKELAVSNMTLVQKAYDEFYQSIIHESVLVGYEFMKPIESTPTENNK